MGEADRLLFFGTYAALRLAILSYPSSCFAFDLSLRATATNAVSSSLISSRLSIKEVG